MQVIFESATISGLLVDIKIFLDAFDPAGAARSRVKNTNEYQLGPSDAELDTAANKKTEAQKKKDAADKRRQNKVIAVSAAPLDTVFSGDDDIPPALKRRPGRPKKVFASSDIVEPFEAPTPDGERAAAIQSREEEQTQDVLGEGRIADPTKNLTFGEIKETALALITYRRTPNNDGLKVLGDILGAYNVKKLPQLKEDQYSAFVQECQSHM